MTPFPPIMSEQYVYGNGALTLEGQKLLQSFYQKLIEQEQRITALEEWATLAATPTGIPFP